MKKSKTYRIIHSLVGDNGDWEYHPTEGVIYEVHTVYYDTSTKETSLCLLFYIEGTPLYLETSEHTETISTEVFNFCFEEIK